MQPIVLPCLIGSQTGLRVHVDNETTAPLEIREKCFELRVHVDNETTAPREMPQELVLHRDHQIGTGKTASFGERNKMESCHTQINNSPSVDQLGKVKVGDVVCRRMGVGGPAMDLKVTELTDNNIICGPWSFDRRTGGEIDEDLGWTASLSGTYIERIKFGPTIEVSNERELPNVRVPDYGDRPVDRCVNCGGTEKPDENNPCPVSFPHAAHDYCDGKQNAAPFGTAKHAEDFGDGST